MVHTGGGPITRKPASPRRPYVHFTRWRRAHFFRVLEETGHVQMAAEAAGVSLGCIYRLRRVEAGFIQKMVAAVEKADRRLEAQEGRQSGDGHVTATNSSGTSSKQQALVIRRGIGGRLRVMAAGRHCWTGRHDSIFFGRDPEPSAGSSSLFHPKHQRTNEASAAAKAGANGPGFRWSDEVAPHRSDVGEPHSAG